MIVPNMEIFLNEDIAIMDIRDYKVGRPHSLGPAIKAGQRDSSRAVSLEDRTSLKHTGDQEESQINRFLLEFTDQLGRSFT